MSLKTMPPLFPSSRRVALILIVAAATGSGPGHLVGAEPVPDPKLVVSVFAAASPDYRRTRDADGHWRAESYAFGEGGATLSDAKDNTIEKLGFLDVARAIAPALARENYTPCNPGDLRRADLLIMVYWGATRGTENTAHESAYQLAQEFTPPPRALMSPPPTGQGGTAMVSDPSTSGRGSEASVLQAQQTAIDSALQQSLVLTTLANRQRDQQNYATATLLGYLPEMQRVRDFGQTSLEHRRDDVMAEIEEARYYVILLAYDFRRLAEHKERKLRWEARYSIRERRQDFGAQLAAMSAAAAPLFGQDSPGLTRQTLPAGHVEFGEPQVVGYETGGK
jgi:hypothetical protein